ncbi:MAG TPA: hypothetical protein VK466_08455 [Terriglobales bacterium]|nr:hypothetical protein [Terriglobales bacterium]
MKNTTPPRSPIRLLIADSSQMQLQLLSSALRRRPEFAVRTCPLDPELILTELEMGQIQVLLLDVDTQGSSWTEMALLRRIHIAFPKVAKVLLLEAFDRDLVVNAFRSGARGLFSFAASLFRSLCKCIQVVHRGEIWANAQQIQYLVDLVAQVLPCAWSTQAGTRSLRRGKNKSWRWWPKACRTATLPANWA